jgi:hypothetical protein
MFNNWKELIPVDFNDDSRVWIYQASRLFSLSEALEIEVLLENFAATWLSHGAKVKGYGNLLFGQFVVLMADETAAGVSGCSTDSSVRLIKDIEKMTGVTMFDRTTLAFILKGKVQLLPMTQLPHAIKNNFINAQTPYFNNVVLTKKDLLDNWIIESKDSWLGKRYFSNAEQQVSLN